MITKISAVALDAFFLWSNLQLFASLTSVIPQGALQGPLSFFSLNPPLIQIKHQFFSCECYADDWLLVSRS